MVKKKRRKQDAMDRITDFDLATAIHRSRKPHAQDVDNGTVARMTKHIEVWATDPSRFDFAGVDTPVRREPKKLNQNRALAKARRQGLI